MGTAMRVLAEIIASDVSFLSPSIKPLIR